MSKTCPQCNHSINDNSNFCTNCGAKIDTLTPPEIPQPVPPPPPVTPQAPPPVTPPPATPSQAPPNYQQGPPPNYQQAPPNYQQGPPPNYQQAPPNYQQGPPPNYQQRPPKPPKMPKAPKIDGEAGSFLNFEKLLLPSFIMPLFLLLAIGALAKSIMAFVNGLIFSGIYGLIFDIIYARIICEVVIILYRIHMDLKAIREDKKKKE